MQHQANVNFAWTPGGNGVYAIHLSGPGGSPTYGNINGTSRTISAPSTPGTYIWYVTSNGQQSALRTIKVI